MARASTMALVCCAVAVVVWGAAVEARQNCICECMKTCIRTEIPAMEGCSGKCKEKACIESCEDACVRKGFPKLPDEGIPLCEHEPFSPHRRAPRIDVNAQ